MIQLLLLYFLMIVLTSIFINGFYNITRGRWIYKPDSNKEWVGKIFSFWSKLLQHHKVNILFYKGGEFYKQVTKLKEFFSDTDIIEILDNAIIVNKMEAKTLELFKVFAASNDILFTSREYGNGRLISVYKEEIEYTIPNYVRAPLGECLACMSSFYGTLCWIIWYQITVQVSDINITDVSATLLGLSFSAKVVMWVFFCISISYLNEVIFNINQKLGK